MFGRIEEYNSEKFPQLIGNDGYFFRGNFVVEEKVNPDFLAVCGVKTYETLKNFLTTHILRKSDLRIVELTYFNQTHSGALQN